ncbi:MAG: YMGG-like glycine zipper-containing protein, partial [Pseudomonadota bacterium]
MRHLLLITGLVVAAAAAPSLASARSACDQRAHDRKVTGTVLGAVGGALIGNAVADGKGAIIGGVGGAVVGN